MTRLHQLHDLGQSVWLDYILRDMLGPDGELASLVEKGVRGVTSNPSIFQKAIAGSDAYDDQIRSVIDGNPDADAAAVFEELAVRDIQGATDVLRSVYDASGGTDGLVSIEVAPNLAYDTAGTLEAARRLWSKVDRPNLLVKVPATAEGIPAVEQLISEGININITLMFSLADYESVAQAYMNGLAAADDPSSINSVASFFVSRVDTKTDDALEKVGTDQALALRGRIAIANAKLAYRRFQEIFLGEPFAALRDAGANPQKVLWASTSTKNPEYPDVLYVDELIGPCTVNTMPPATIDATLDHARVRLTIGDDVAGADDDIARLATLGIDFDAITAELQTEGVQAFADSMYDLYDTIAAEMDRLRSA